MVVASLPSAGFLHVRFLAVLSAVAIGTCGVRSDAVCPCEQAADGFAVERAGLEREWLVQIPFDSAGFSLEHVVVGSDLVIVQTGDGNVVAVQAAAAAAGNPSPGTILWKHPIDGHGGPSPAASISGDIVAVCHGDGILAFDRVDGHIRWSRRFPHLADSAPAVSGGWVYTPFGSDKVMRLPADPYRDSTPRTAAAESGKEAGGPDKPKPRSARKPARAENRKSESLEPLVLESGGAVSLQPQPYRDGVLWCTDEGKLVVLEPGDEVWFREEFFLGVAPAVSPLVHQTAIFVATTAGDLARIDRQDVGLRLAWSSLLSARPESALSLAGERLIVPLGDDGIAAVSITTGETVWRSPLQGRFVAVAAGRVWLVDRIGRLVSIDLETGAPRDRFCLGDFTFPVVNSSSDRLILASPQGALISLKAP